MASDLEKPLDEQTNILDGNDDNKEDDKNKEKEKEKIPDYGGTSKLTREYGGGYCYYISFGYIFSLLNGATTPCFALIFRELMEVLGETITNPNNTSFQENSIRVMIYFISMGVGAFIFTLCQYYFWSVYGIKIAVKVRKEYFNALLAQDMSYHDEKTSGILNAELITECSAIEQGIGQKTGIAYQYLGTFMFGAGLALYYSWKLTLVLTATIPVLIFVGVIQGMLLHRTSGAADPFAKAGGFSQEVLTNIRNVQAFPYLMKQKYDEYKELVLAAAPVARKRGLIGGIGAGAMLFGIIGVMYAVGLYSGATFVAKGAISQGDMFGAFFAYMMAGLGLGQMASIAGDLQKAKTAANKFYHIKQREPQIKQSNTNKLINNIVIKGEIEFKNVTFSYPTAPNKIILDNISFKVNTGESLALVGPSGSGKTTIVALLERYYDPNDGEIFVDGNPIEDYDIQFLRNNMGLVSQNPLLFDASVSENIRAGSSQDNITQNDIIDAAKIANADDFINKLEDGYGTRVGELGNRLSGGQKQRVVIARAILNKPKILLLDEATSALDSQNEKDVQIALDKINKLHAQTTITIAHQLSTIKDHTNILVLVHGKKKEYGNHETLLQSNGVYSALVTAQRLTGEVGSANNAKYTGAKKKKELQIFHD